MPSAQFELALTATGYINKHGEPAAGLERAGAKSAIRLRSALLDSRIGLEADAVFTVQGSPAAIFKDAAAKPPTDLEIKHWHEAAWNLGVAPLLWIITPTEVRLYDCYASPPRDVGQDTSAALAHFDLSVPERLASLNRMCGRLATETGAFWSSEVGKQIDRRHRVDRELLSEISALEEKLTELPGGGRQKLKREDEVKASRAFAQRLIGRCIFSWYLLDRGIATQFLPASLPPNLSKLFKTRAKAFGLFRWLRRTFNGDLFPMDDPGAERQRLTDAHLALLRDFVEGRSLKNGQGRLFRFRFDAIPVDLISSIYQQFARSSAADEAHVQGLHYTPIEVVHLTLDPVFEGLSKGARIIDPACGSGAFLVEAFRRLVWRNAGAKKLSRKQLRSILYNQLFGIDINSAALGIAAFSLYLAALEFDVEPVSNIEDLRFDRLIGSTLFSLNTIEDSLPAKLIERPFDAVVGNPPWTFDSRNNLKRRQPGVEDSLRPRRSPDQTFLNVGAQLAGSSGRIGMVMKATPFFSKDVHAVQAKNALLKSLSPVALVNLSALRKEDLFPDASGPAMLFFARCALSSGPDRVLVGSLPWTPDFRRNGIFHVGAGEFRNLPLAKVLESPAVLKAAAFGTARDAWLIQKLEKELPTLDEVLSKAGLHSGQQRGQGFQVAGSENKPPPQYSRLRVVSPENYRPFRISIEGLPRFSHASLHRPREASIFRGPLVICPKASYGAAAERGRYSSSLIATDVLYTESFYGISFAGQNEWVAHALNAILNSSLTTFQLAFGGGAWGLERSTIEPKDLLSLRVPDIFQSGFDIALLEAEQIAAAEGASPSSLALLDDAVFKLYELEPDEAVLARESVVRSRMLVFESRKEREKFVRPATEDALASYASAAVRVVDRYLRAKGKRHLEATIYARPVSAPDWQSGAPGLTAVRFSMGLGPPDRPVIRRQQASDMAANIESALDDLEANIAPYLNERRLLRLYLGSDLFVLKPNEMRYWTESSGLNDADVILADHWLGEQNAAHG